MKDENDDSLQEKETLYYRQPSIFDKGKEFIFGIGVVCISLFVGVLVMNLFDKSRSLDTTSLRKQNIPTETSTPEITPEFTVIPSQEIISSPTVFEPKELYYISQKNNFQVKHPSLNVNPCVSVPFGMSDGYVTDVVLAKGEPENDESCGEYWITIGLYPQAKESDIDGIINTYFQTLNKDEYLITEGTIAQKNTKILAKKLDPNSKLYIFSKTENGPVYIIEIVGISKSKNLDEIERTLSTFELI